MSTSTPAFADADSSGGGGGPPVHGAAVVAEFRGVGVALAKSLSFTSVSVHPPPARRSAVVLLSAGAPSEPS